MVGILEGNCVGFLEGLDDITGSGVGCLVGSGEGSLVGDVDPLMGALVGEEVVGLLEGDLVGFAVVRRGVGCPVGLFVG